MSNKIDRRSFLKVLGIAGAACAMTALTGCDEEGTPSFPAGDGSVSLSSLKPFNGSVPWNGKWLPEDPFGNVDRKSTRLNSSHSGQSRMPSSA